MNERSQYRSSVKLNLSIIIIPIFSLYVFIHVHLFNITFEIFPPNIGSPVKVIGVVPVQLIASVSSGVTSFILGLHLLSSRPGLWDHPLFSLMTRRRFSEVVSLVRRAAAANSDPAVLVQRLSTPTTAVVSTETIEKQDTAIRFVLEHLESRITYLWSKLPKFLEGFTCYVAL